MFGPQGLYNFDKPFPREEHKHLGIYGMKKLFVLFITFFYLSEGQGILTRFSLRLIIIRCGKNMTKCLFSASKVARNKLYSVTPLL